MIAEQVYIFLYAILAGVVAAFLYDILRIKRRAIKTGVIFVSIEDLLYWLIAAVLLFVTVYNSNNGQMRGFIFIGNVIGVILYETLFSNIVIKSSITTINIIKLILRFIWNVLSYPFKLLYKIISIPALFIFGLIVKILRLIGRGFRLAFGKADVKGKARMLGKKARGVKSKVGGLGKKSFRRIIRKKEKIKDIDESSLAQKKKRRTKKVRKKKMTSQNQNDDRAS